LKAVVGALKDQQATVTGMKALARQNQPNGFDCPGCAWPDPKHTSAFEFCENGAKAVTWGGDDKAWACADARFERWEQDHSLAQNRSRMIKIDLGVCIPR
jgi:hypothetical protein